MTDQSSNVTLVAGGMQYTAFTRAAVTYAANQAARAFAFTVTDATDPWDEQWKFMPGTPVTVLANGQLLLTGYVDKMTPSFDRKSSRSWALMNRRAISSNHRLLNASTTSLPIPLPGHRKMTWTR